MKRTIKFIIYTSLMLISIHTINAQSTSSIGIYGSAKDFESGKYKQQINCNSGNKILVDKLLNSNSITIKENGKKTTLLKSSVYGYHTCNNENYRFYKNDSYKIIDTGHIFIYSEYHYENPVKGKGGMIKVEKIHFSVTSGSDIFSFTKENILKSFPESNKLRMWLLNSSSKVEDLLQKDSNKKLLIQNLILN